MYKAEIENVEDPVMEFSENIGEKRNSCDKSKKRCSKKGG